MTFGGSSWALGVVASSATTPKLWPAFSESCCADRDRFRRPSMKWYSQSTIALPVSRYFAASKPLLHERAFHRNPLAHHRLVKLRARLRQVWTSLFEGGDSGEHISRPILSPSRE